MSVPLCQATSDDIDTLLHHRAEMFREMGFSAAETAPALAAARTYFTSALPSGACRGWLALSQEKIIAGGLLLLADWPGVPNCNSPHYPWILNIYVEPEFRHQGIATLLTNTMIEFCRAANFASVALHASAQGRALYEKLGFRQTSEMRLMLRGHFDRSEEP